ncbi:hypothetical protein IWX78_001164 [Mycetocola sp. CAN_C7]|uniref:hypothetical protein n=1 Tax=Mycetocola sp. CAN_C7 TaxID=2787724 RepID=UPI0018C8F04D
MSSNSSKDLSRVEPFNRCTAHKKNGDQCKKSAIRGGRVCRSHGGAAPQVRARAERRILEASDKAASLLVEMMSDKKTAPALKIKVAQDLLDRAGISGRQALDISVSEKPKWEMVAEDILIDIEEDDDNFFPQGIVDVEVVEDDPEALAQRDREDELKAVELERRQKRVARRGR